jgi:NADPH-dependent curcumin reductase CurA
MTMEKNRDIRLAARPDGLPKPSDFHVYESAIPSPGEGQVLVRNLYMSVDPYMRGRLSGAASYVSPFQIGEVLSGGAIGKVTGGGTEGLKIGDYVISQNGWREWFVSDGKALRKIDPTTAPLAAYLGVLGMTGMTAYVGMTKIGGVKEDDRVLVSAAAGAVGSIVCQIARNLGCRTVGIAGTDEKCAYLRNELKIRAINYRNGDLAEAIQAESPSGIDLFFDNVGGSQLAAALEAMRTHGRIVACGMIETYNGGGAHPALSPIVTKRLTMRGFIVGDHLDLRERFERDMTRGIKEGKISWRETIVEGIENAPAALIGLFTGANIGKMVVKLAEDV